MENISSGYLSNLTLGDLKQFKNMGVIPLFAPSNGGPPYLVMKEALEGSLLTVTEVGQSGTVPELKVTNNADIPVLLLDGEELAGAKQNRVLNTTILLKEKSETVIPVSCTEQGRWSYATDRFYESGHIMSQMLRKANKQSVSLSLKEAKSFRGNQGAVWEGIHDQHVRARVDSATHAMKDVFEAKERDLNDYLGYFASEPDQRGLLVMINDAVAGLDLVSLDSAYRLLHPKLLKSYAMDAILEEKKGGGGSAELAQAFLKGVLACEEKKYDSIGHGWDYRFEGKKFVGSALVYKEAVIHAAFFTIEAAEKAGNMAGFSRRRGFRA